MAGAIAEATPLFRAISTGGRVGGARLSDGSIARIVKARCAAAGLEPREFAGHSLRAGMVTSAAEHGIAEWRIRLTSRHKSDVLRQYIRPVEKRQHSLTNDIGCSDMTTPNGCLRAITATLKRLAKHGDAE